MSAVIDQIPGLQDYLKRRLQQQRPALPDLGAIIAASRAQEGADAQPAPAAPAMTFEPMAAPPPRQNHGAALGAGLGKLLQDRGRKLLTADTIPAPRLPVHDVLPDLKFYGNGGKLRKGESAIVGDATADNPSGLEEVKYGKDGVKVTPLKVPDLLDNPRVLAILQKNLQNLEAERSGGAQPEMMPNTMPQGAAGEPGLLEKFLVKRLRLDGSQATQQPHAMVAAPAEPPAMRPRVVAPEERTEAAMPELARIAAPVSGRPVTALSHVAPNLRLADPNSIEADATLPPGGVSRQVTPAEAAGVQEEMRYVDDGQGGMRAATGQTRERYARPVETAVNRQIQRELEGGNRTDNNGLLRSMGATGVRGLASHGLPGLIGGLIGGAADRSADERAAHDEELQLGRGQVARVSALSKAGLEDQGMRADVAYKQIRPQLETDKLALKRQYDAWRIQSGNRRQDSLESYREFMKGLGDRRADTAEGRLDLEREWRTVIQPGQFQQNYDQKESHFTRRQQQRAQEFEQRLGLDVDKFIETRRHNLVGEAKGRFDSVNKDRIPRLKAIYKEIESWQKEKGTGSQRGGYADEMISELQSEALGIAAQIEATRDALLSGQAIPSLPAPNNATPVKPNVRRGTAAVRAPAARPAAAVPKKTEAEIRAFAIEKGLNPDRMVEKARERGELR